MRKLDWYVGKSVLFAILSVLLVLLGLACLFALVDELRGIGKGDYGFVQALNYLLYTIPKRLYDLLPMGVLIGSLIGLGTLASNSELTVMRAAGVSIKRIVWAVMKPMLLIMVLGLAIGEYLAPWAENIAESNRAVAQSGSEAISSKRGLWHRQGTEYFHANAIQPSGKMFGVTRYKLNQDRQLVEASFAKNAVYQDGKWQLNDVAITRLFPRYSETEHAATLEWEADFDPALLNTVIMKPDALSISGLWRYAHYLEEQELKSENYWLAFWGKVLQPLITAALVLMAISFIFGPLRSVTLGQRLFTGVLVGFIFQIAQDLLGPASVVFGFAPLLAVLLPAMICSCIGLWLLRRAG